MHITDFNILGVTVHAEFSVDADWDVSLEEVSIGGQDIEEGFLSPFVMEILTNKCREYAAKDAEDAADFYRGMREAA